MSETREVQRITKLEIRNESKNGPSLEGTISPVGVQQGRPFGVKEEQEETRERLLFGMCA
jgi:hypothetical protein